MGPGERVPQVICLYYIQAVRPVGRGFKRRAHRMSPRALGATVLDYDMNSKIRAHCPMRNEQGYNSLTGRSAIADVQTSVRGAP